MRKSTGILKRYLATFLIVLMSIESFAAVVGDNDGAAFITKAEFDSMKNDFQSQLDRYNSSLDNKIDGAIASYLSGVKVAAVTKTRCLGYDSNNVLSVIQNTTFPWKEGTMNTYGWVRIVRFDDGIPGKGNTSIRKDSHPYTGLYVFNMPELTTDDLVPFSECAIKNIDWSEQTAEWIGYNTSYYKWRLYVTNIGNYGIGAGVKDNGQLALEFAARRSVSSTLSDHREFGLRSDMLMGGSGWDAFTTPRSGNDWGAALSQSTIYRYPVRASNSSIISTRCDNQMLSFVNYDGIYDWMNDTDTTPNETHTVLTTTDSKIVSAVNAAFAVTAKQPESALAVQPWYTGKNEGFNDEIGTGRWGTNSYPVSNVITKWEVSSGSTWQFYKPYVGFARNYISNWNQIFLSKYDDLIFDLKQCEVDPNFIKNNGKEHLPVTAGLPICKVGRQKSLVLPLKFKDNKDHYVWIKYATFRNNLDPQNDPDTITTFQYVLNDGISDDTLINTSIRAIKVPANKTVKIKTHELADDAFVFIKWSLTDNSYAGGGEFITPYEVDVEG